jgi:2-polyprenyl-3-methyl-5-hydroxy-6-metoxy-1,4-benzoquinol methylase
MVNDLLVNLFGPWALTVQGDPLVGDRRRWLRRHLQSGPIRTLDAGCGNGAFSFYAAQQGNRVLGLTFSSDEQEKDTRRAALLQLDKSVEFRLQDLRRLGEVADSLGRFDQIICLEVIEHVLDDRQLVNNLAGLLNPGGRLILSTPYKHYRRLYGEYLSETEDGGHVRWGYTHEELRELFQAAGLEIEVEEYLAGVISQSVTNMMRVLHRIHPRMAWAATLPFRPAIALDPIATRMTRYPWMTVGVVGRKPGAAA